MFFKTLTLVCFLSLCQGSVLNPRGMRYCLINDVLEDARQNVEDFIAQQREVLFPTAVNKPVEGYTYEIEPARTFNKTLVTMPWDSSPQPNISSRALFTDDGNNTFSLNQLFNTSMILKDSLFNFTNNLGQVFWLPFVFPDYSTNAPEVTTANPTTVQGAAQPTTASVPEGSTPQPSEAFVDPGDVQSVINSFVVSWNNAVSNFLNALSSWNPNKN